MSQNAYGLHGQRGGECQAVAGCAGYCGWVLTPFALPYWLSFHIIAVHAPISCGFEAVHFLAGPIFVNLALTGLEGIETTALERRGFFISDSLAEQSRMVLTMIF